jgi:hypothetical protein
MRKNYAFVLAISIICASLLPLVSLIRVSYALPSARLYLDPPSNTFYSNSTGVGHRFNVTVWAENVTNGGGVQVYMDFNDTFINVTRWFDPKNDPQYLFGIRGTMALPTPPNDVNYLHVGVGKGRVLVSVSLYPAEVPWINGSGKVCIFEIEMTAAPFVTNQLTSTLHIDTTDTFVIDGISGLESPGTTKEDGTYTYVLTPRLYLDPSENVFDANVTNLGHRFNVTVWVANVTGLAAAQIYLEFNDTMINATRWFEPKNDTDYIFYGKTTSSAPSVSNETSYIHLAYGKARVMVTIVLFPTPPAQPTVSGSGKICTFEFNVTSLPPKNCILSLHNLTDIGQTYLLDGSGVEISGVKLEDGSYTFIPELTSVLALPLLMASTAVIFLFRKKAFIRKTSKT